MLGWLLVAGCPKPGTPVEAAPKPSLVVLVVVDQLPTRLLDRAAPLLRGGLARLTGDQAFHAVGRYAHAYVATCPGHATISTGAAPSVSGIVSNEWYTDGGPGVEPVYCGDIGLVRVETLADRVTAAGGQVAALSIKDRSAIMLGGRSPALESWLDKDGRRFRPPLDDVPLDAYYAAEWTATYPEDYARIAGPDDGPREADVGFGTTFPHPAATAAPAMFAATPFAGSALTDAAIAAVDRLRLGGDATPDLLAVSYSEVDYVGHAYTSESWEALDDLVRLDADLQRLTDHLDQAVGRDRYALLLTSDHGSVDPTGPRLDPDAVVKAASAAVSGGEVLFEGPTLWLPAALRHDPATRAPAARAVADAVAALPGVAGAFPWRDAPVDNEHAAEIAQSVDPERSGDVYVLLAPNTAEDRAGQAGKGTSHGSPYPDEDRVPLLAVGAGVAPGTSTEDLDVRRVAPTLAALIGVPPPSSATLPPIAELLR
jgi:predicted AlkP superfamily pyrophosphatase or phosphodiesterase